MNPHERDTKRAIDRFLAAMTSHDIPGIILYSPDNIAVMMAGKRRRVLATAAEMGSAAHDVFLETGIDIAPVPVWRDEWERLNMDENPILLRNIVRDAVRQWRKLRDARPRHPAA